MLSTFPKRCENLIWFVIFTFTLSCMPHLQHLGYKFHFAMATARADEVESTAASSAAANPETVEQAQPDVPADTESAQIATATASSAPSANDRADVYAQGSFKVDDFTGSAHYGYPIVVPPGMYGLPNYEIKMGAKLGDTFRGMWTLM